MSSTVTISSRTRELDGSIGLLLDGYVLTMILFGFVVFQSYIYTSRYPSDKIPMKIMIFLIWALDTAAVGALTKALHIYTIVDFPQTFAGVPLASTSLCADNGLAMAVIFLVQLGYAHRMWTVLHNHAVVLLSILLAAGSFGLGVVMTVRMSQFETLDLMATNPTKAIVACCQALALAGAIIVFVVLCLNARGESSRTIKGGLEWTLDSIMKCGVEFGGFAVLIQIAYIIAFLVAPSKRYWMPFQLVNRRLFAIGLLSMVNARKAHRGRGLYAEEMGDIASSAATSTVFSNGMSVTMPKFANNTKNGLSTTKIGHSLNIHISHTVDMSSGFDSTGSEVHDEQHSTTEKPEDLTDKPELAPL